MKFLFYYKVDDFCKAFIHESKNNILASVRLNGKSCSWLNIDIGVRQ